MKLHLLACLATALVVLGATTSHAEANPCPRNFKHERTGILHKSPRSRIMGGKSVSGRVCMDLTKPSQISRLGGQRKLVCPIGYQDERAGIFQDSPKKRLLNDSNTVHWDTKQRYIANRLGKNKQRRTCIAVVRPGTDVGKAWAPKPTRNDPMVSLRGARFNERTRGFMVIDQSRAPRDSACFSRCQSNGRCVVASFAGSTCTLYTRFDYLKGDRIATNAEDWLITPLERGSRNDKVAFKRSRFWGKVDYSQLYTKRQEFCPDNTEPKMPSAPRDLGLPRGKATDAPRACLGNQTCGVVVVNDNRPRREMQFYREVKKRKSSGSKCTTYRLRRTPAPAPGGKA